MIVKVAEERNCGGELNREEPDASDSDRGEGAEPQQRALESGPTDTRPARDPPDGRGEAPHSYDAAGPEAEQVGARDGVRE